MQIASKDQTDPHDQHQVNWDGHHETFDELNAIVEGHCDGYGATHLVHLDFITTNLEKEYKTCAWYPDLKLMAISLEKQNCALYSSLKLDLLK